MPGRYRPDRASVFVAAGSLAEARSRTLYGDVVTAIGVGVIGCGKATQALHLPSLRQLPAKFRIVSVCDASASVAEQVAESWAIGHWTTEADELLARRDVEAVLVANPNRFHAATAQAALAKGKHVLLEKPAAMSLAELDEVIATEREAVGFVQVGYMRRFAPGFVAAQARLAEIGEIRVVRVHDLIDAGLQLLESTTAVLRDESADAGSLNLNQDESEPLRRALGDVPAAVQNAYQLLLRLGCHDLSTLRGLIGVPRGVLHAAERCNGRYLGATLDYGQFLCQFDLGLNIVATADIRTELVGAHGTLVLDYALPYVRHQPARLTTSIINAGGDVERQVHESQGKDQFVLQWEDFFANVVDGRMPKNSLADARADLVIAMQIIDALKEYRL
jgi:predicted dehydrogenase